MLKKETLQQIAKLLRLREADLEAAIADEKEVDFPVDTNLHVFTETEVTTLKNNEYKNGKDKGVEMVVKETKEKLGLEFQGKTIDGLIGAATKKALEDAKIEPEKQVKELQEKLTTVQSSYKQLELQVAEKDNEVSNVKIKNEVFKYIPAFGEDAPQFDQEDIYSMMKLKGYEFKNESGKTVAYKDGKQVLDKVSEPVAVKDVVNSFLMEKKLITEDRQPAGRGGGNGKPTTKFTALSELKKNFTDQGKSLNGQEFMQAVEKATKDNPEFALDK
jgi:hypothetical protein